MNDLGQLCCWAEKIKDGFFKTGRERRLSADCSMEGSRADYSHKARLSGFACSTNPSFKVSGGFSLIEVLIVVAILGILIVLTMFFIQRHLMRARDTQRKSDLDKIRTAWEEYYNDNRCYPPPHHLLNCGSTSLSPYLKTIPCDPLTKQGYLYQSLAGDYCAGYRILVRLEVETDVDITAVGCDPVEGCGGNDGEDYNWGVAVGERVGYYNTWETGGTAGENGDTAFYCAPIASADDDLYHCDDLTYSERVEYFYDCRAFESDEECQSQCLGVDPIPDEVVCICIEGSSYEFCE